MRELRADFPMLSREIEGDPLIYLDSAATSLKPQAVIDAVTRCYTHHTANVHRGVHALGQEATEAFEATRTRLGRFFRAEDDQFIYTRNTTEAINIVHRCLPNVRRVVTTVAEHHSNYLPWMAHERCRVVGVTPIGELDLDDLDAALREGADLVAVAYVSNALGVVHPIAEIVRRCHAAGALVLMDAAQAAPHMPIDLGALDVDFMACSAHKMLGPTGAGVLYGKRALLERMEPWLLGSHTVETVSSGGAELKPVPARFEAGTPPIEAFVGWGAALSYLSALGMDAVQAHDHALVTYALEQLGTIRGVRIVGPRDANRRGASVAFTVAGLEAHGAARMLSNRSNVLVRSGFHCAQPLHQALGLPPTVRASFYVYSEREDIDVLCACLRLIVANL